MVSGGGEPPALVVFLQREFGEGHLNIRCLPDVLLEDGFSAFYAYMQVPGVCITGTQCLLSELMIENHRLEGGAK